MNKTGQTILRRLREADGFVSGENLSKELGVSRTAISKHVKRLRSIGYDIESVPRRGHCLRGTVNQARSSEVQPLLKTQYFGRAFVYKEDTGSTNRDAMELAQDGAPHGTVLVADTQQAGRGRMDRKWISPPGTNLYTSVVLRPPLPAFRIPELALVAAVALRDAIDTELPADTPRIRIKWPNDIWAGERKVAGVLCEMSAETDRVHHVVIGIGINVNMDANDFPPELRQKAQSMKTIAGKTLSRPRLLARFLNQFETCYNTWARAEDLSPFVEEWTRHSVLTNRHIRVEQQRQILEGTARGIDETGRLLLTDAAGETITVHAGDVHLLPLAPPPGAD